jgi:hypothetical protein
MKKFLLICTFLCAASLSFAQEYKYHPIFIYNFSKYIEWPADKNNQDFIISVVGNNSAYREMLDIVEKKKTIKNRNLVVKKCNSMDEVGNSDVLFVTKHERISPEIIQAKQQKGTLIITEHDNMAEQASHINFILTEDSKIGFELNSALAEAAGLKVSNSLAGLAKKTY